MEFLVYVWPYIYSIINFRMNLLKITTNVPNYIHTNVHKINKPIQDITPQRILEISGFRCGESSRLFFHL
jgi:hypothetical protein